MQYFALRFAACILLSGFLAGCDNENKPVKVTGQVFVVTKGGENIKLGLVTVRIVSQADYGVYDETFNNAENSKLSALKVKFEDAKDRYNRALEKCRPMLSDYTRRVEALLDYAKSINVNLPSSPTDFSITDVTADEAAKINELQGEIAAIGAKMKPAFDEATSAYQDMEDCSSEASDEADGSIVDYIEHFPGQSTKTDADGKFFFSMPPASRYVVAAESSRAVANSTEIYHWVQGFDVPKDSHEVSILMSNDTLSERPPLIVGYVGELPDNALDFNLQSQLYSYTFTDSNGQPVQPSSAQESSQFNATSQTASATASSATVDPDNWTAPNPLPKHDNWTWKTTDGKIYNKVVVQWVQPDIVSIMHADGGGSVDISTLPPDIQSQLNYNPSAAARARANRAAASANQSY